MTTATPYDDEITCPTCKGSRESGVSHTVGRARVIQLCPTCKGDGVVSKAEIDELNQEIDDGEAFDLAEDR
jgi:DnaJ-class molecular chaperone